jgi:enoyl-CoA hydratase/carnithine racemase
MAAADHNVVVARQGAVLQVRIQRPARRNALAGADWAALAAAFADPGDARVLVLSGVPGAFSAGADIEELAELLREPARFAASNALVQDAQRALARLPLATIAAIDGVCVGGGLGLALACDFRIATARSRFAITPAKLGLVYGTDDTRRLVGAVGAARAREMLLTGRLLDAAEADAFGLLTRRVADDGLDAAVDALVAELLAMSPSAIAGIKRVLAHVSGDPAVDADAARRAFDDAFHSADFAEGARAFLERRPPKFG